MKYGYARVSSKHQDLATQLQLLENERCDQIFSEKISGKNINRPQFQQVLSILEPGDMLVVAKLDRFARSTKEALEIIDDLFHQGIKIHVLDIGIIDNENATGKLIFTVMFAFATFERDLILERTREGKERARENPDFREGRPRKFKKVQMEHALNLLETNSYKQVENLTGISTSTLYRYKKERQIGEA